jgi:ribosomal protein S6
MDEKEKDLEIITENDSKEPEDSDSLVYEIGFQFIPTITAEESEKTFEDLKSVLEKNGAEFISEGLPELRDLAYEMSKKIAGKYQKFTKGYFGWVKFVFDKSKVVELQKTLEVMDNMLRFFIIKTVRENTLISQKFQGGRRQEGGEEEGSITPASPAEPMAPEAMDQEIEKTLEDLEIK